MGTETVTLSKNSLVGNWQVSRGTLSLFLSKDKSVYGELKDKFGQSTAIDSHQVKGGINRNMQPIEIYEMCKTLFHISRLTVVLHANQSRQFEVVVFPSLCAAAKKGTRFISLGDDQLSLAEKLKDNCQFEEAAKAFKRAIRFFTEGTHVSDVAVESTEKRSKAELSLAQLNLNHGAMQCLASEDERLIIEVFAEDSDSIDGLYEDIKIDDTEKCDALSLFKKACVEEHRKNKLLAAELYLQLSKLHRSNGEDGYELNCLLKAAELVDSLRDKKKYANFLEMLDFRCLCELSRKTSNEKLEKILSQKYQARMFFEEFLSIVKKEGEKKYSSPRCFICYSLEEDVTLWLKKTFVPDLDRIGVQPIVSFRGLSYGGDLLPFEKLIRQTQLVVIICTPDMKKKCIERRDSPYGVAMEIRLAGQRYNDKDKKDLIFPTYVKGSMMDALPDEVLEPTFSFQFNGGVPEKSSHYLSNVEYFSKVLELFCVMRGLSRERGSTLLEQFFEELEKATAENVSPGVIRSWLNCREGYAEKVLESVQVRVSNMIQLYNVPPPPDKLFGREQQMKELQELCQQSTRVAVTGLGGMGKTALALYYAHHRRDYYRFVYFISSESPHLIKEGLLELARRLYIPGSKSKDILKNLKERLSDLEDKFLLIFDGIDHPDAFNFLNEYLPDSGTCFFLTSRGYESAVQMHFKTVALKELSIRDAALLLLKIAEKSEEELVDAETLAKELGCLPLALVQAGSVIRRRNWSVRTYIDSFRELGAKELLTENYEFIKKKFNLENLSPEDQELVRTKYVNSGEGTVFKTWTITMRIIKEEHHCLIARQILGYCSLMENAPIPLFFIRDWCQLAFPQHRYDEGLMYLIDYSMVSKDEVEFYLVHPIVKVVSRAGLTSSEQESLVKQAIKTLASLSEKYNQDHKITWEYARPIVAHFPSLLRFLSKEMKQDCQVSICLHQIYKNLVPYLTEVGSHDLAIHWAESALELSRDLYGASSAESARDYFRLGVAINSDAGHWKAEEKLDQAIKIYRSFCPDKKALESFSGRLQFAETLVYMGRVKMGQEDYKVAKNFLIEAEEMLTFDSPEMEVHASLQNNLGELCVLTDDHEKGIGYLKKAREIREKIYDKHDLKYIGTLADLGLTMFYAGRKKEGLELQESALKLYEDFRGVDYATTVNNVGFCYLKLRKFDEAKKYLVRSVELRKQIYGPTHQWVGTPLHHLARVYCQIRQFEEAEKLFLELVAINRKCKPGKLHFELASSLCELGQAQLELQNLKDAKLNIEEGFKMLEELFKVDQKKRMVVGLIARGKLYEIEGKLKLAEDDLRMAVMLVQQNFPSDHPDLINPTLALGHFLIKYEVEAEGKQYLKSASEIVAQIELAFQLDPL